MARLSELTTFIKSANAGASRITFDMGFASRDLFDRVAASGAVSPAAIAPLFGIAPEEVAVFAYLPALMIKVTIPRPAKSGGVAERDFDGVQQFAPLLDLEVPPPADHASVSV